MKKISTFKRNSFWAIYAFSAFISLTLISCKKSDSDGSKAEAGYATGRVTDTKGNPVQGVSVIIENQMTGNHNYLNGVTDKNGFYKIKLSAVGTFQISAEKDIAFNNKQYKMQFHKDNSAVFGPDGGPSAVRNFQWRLSGPGNHETDGYYGGGIEISTELGSYIDDIENAEFKLEPQGSLIDGTPGAILTLKCGAPMTTYYGQLVSIPIAKYKLSATMVRNGARTPLKVRHRDSGDQLTDFIIIEFEPSSFLGKNMTAIDFNF